MSHTVDNSIWSAAPTYPGFKDEELHVWQLVLPVEAVIRENFLKILSPDECIRLKKYHFEIDRDKFLVSRGGLRTILARYLNILPQTISFSYTKFGKPYLCHSKLRFNVSHSGNYIFYAIAEAVNVGIDIEECKSDIDFLSIAKHFLSENEYNKFLTVSPSERCLAFYRCWTRKEAVSKALGTGLFFPLNQLDAGFLPFEKIALQDFLVKISKNSLYQLYEMQLEGKYIVTIAIKRRSNKIHLWNYC